MERDLHLPQGEPVSGEHCKEGGDGDSGDVCLPGSLMLQAPRPEEGHRPPKPDVLTQEPAGNTESTFLTKR